MLVFVNGIARELTESKSKTESMNIFSSGWLQRMVNKAGSTPLSRIESVFQILQDWVEVPGLRQHLQDALLDSDSLHDLKIYLFQLVQASGVLHPTVVTEQLYMILLGALNAEIRHPGANSLTRAGEGALTLVKAQQPIHRSNLSKYAIVATAMIVAGSLHWIFTRQPVPEMMAEQSVSVVSVASVPVSPDQVAELYHLHEKISTANCSYPQALMLAPEQRAPFIENVVDGNVGNIQPASLVMVSQLYQKVDCYYPPAAMLM